MTNMINGEEIAEWINQSLIAQGYQILGSLEDVQITPWSSVRRILTRSGYIYLKKMPPLLALEPIIIQLLNNECHANVPNVIDINHDLCCFLMEDAGKPFYHFKDNSFRLDLILEAIRKYKDIQNECYQHINRFLALGVPDWRLNQLPLLYNQLIIQEDLLTKDGMSNEDIRKLPTLSSQLTSLCKELSEFAIPETLDHCDLHGANILIDDKTSAITIIDWGETVITHPFLSLTAFLRGLIKYYDFKKNEIWDACFKNNKYPELNDLQQIAALAKKLEPVYSALAFQRLMLSSDEEKFMSAKNCKGRISKYLLEFLAAI